MRVLPNSKIQLVIMSAAKNILDPPYGDYNVLLNSTIKVASALPQDHITEYLGK